MEIFQSKTISKQTKSRQKKSAKTVPKTGMNQKIL
jgi:hypothetical protein